MSKRELKALTVANRELILGEEGRLCSGFARTERKEDDAAFTTEQPQDSDPGRQAEIGNQPGVGTHQLEVGDQQPETSGQLNAEVQILHRELMRLCVLLNDKEAELAEVKRTLTSAKEEAKTAWSKAEEVHHRLAARETELEKLSEIEALRKEFDRERRQLQEDREREAMQFSEWKCELIADRDRLG